MKKETAEVRAALHDLDCWLAGAGADADLNEIILPRIERAADAFRSAAFAIRDDRLLLSGETELDIAAAVAKFEGLLAVADARRST